MRIAINYPSSSLKELTNCFMKFRNREDQYQWTHFQIGKRWI